MILIQSQLCSIDQSDLFIPRSRVGGGWKSIQHLLLFFLFFFFFLSASLFPACLSSSGCARVYTTYVAGKKKEKNATRQIKLTPAHEAIFLHRPTRPNSFVRLHVVFLFWRVCFFVFLFFCLLPVSPPPHRRLAPSTARHQDTPAMLKPARRDR